MKRLLGIIMLVVAFICVGTVPANADTTIIKLDTDSGKYYAEFDRPLDWIVIKQSTGALVWINDTTEFSLEQVKELAKSVNPSLVHSVDYWGVITGYGTFSNNEGDFVLPSGFQGNMWGTYWFMEALENDKFYVDISGVSNVTYSETDEPIITPPDPPDKPEPPDVPEPPTTPEEPSTPDHSPQTGDNTNVLWAWICAIAGMTGIVLWKNNWHL